MSSLRRDLILASLRAIATDEEIVACADAITSIGEKERLGIKKEKRRLYDRDRQRVNRAAPGWHKKMMAAKTLEQLDRYHATKNRNARKRRRKAGIGPKRKMGRLEMHAMASFE